MLLMAALIAEHHPVCSAPPPSSQPPPPPLPSSNNYRNGESLVAAVVTRSLLLPPDAGPPILKGVQSKWRTEMSEIEDLQNASKQDDTQEETAETTEIDNEGSSSIEESDSPELSEKLSKTESEEERESIKEEEQKETPSHEKSLKEETSNSELATVTRSASLDDSMPASMSETAVKQVEPDEPRIPSATAADAEDAQQRHARSGPSTTVGEWNSLPILVERLREALELSLAAGHRRGGGGNEPTSTTLTEPVDIDRSRARRSMEQALLTGDCDHDDLESKKDELKFLEDLLLSDIQTALSRLRETLERTDVATLAKHGGVSDPTSKLHLLRLVSSLLSRLQVPEEEMGGSGSEARTSDIAVQNSGVPVGRRRRAVRHTIGVSAEEIAHARKQLEESSANLVRLNDQVSAQRRELLFPASHSATSSERHVEEIHDKYTKDAINQRQSLRDKNKDSHGDIGAYRLLTPSQIDYTDRPIAAEAVNDANAHRNCRRGSVDSYQEKESDDEETAIKKANEEQSRVTKLAAALRQRAEFLSANRNNNNNNNNKFTAKKSKIKRANTIDIPSYLKLQAGNLGYDNPGCILLRRPINVSDKITSNTSNLAVPPSFHPKTENDKKFLALISRNNETQAVNTAPAFVKSFGYTKRTDASAHENWNSRFSNIKTAFDKPSAVSEENRASSKPHPSAKRSPGFAPQTSPSAMNKKVPIDGTAHNSPFANANVAKSDAGFRHAPSSLFRKIDKTPKSPPICHWQRENALPGNTLREKARIMFDRDNGNVQSQSPSKFNVNKNSQKSAFPRPPWIEHDKNESKSSNMVTENGRLDYRLFCKQFAPFIGKNTTPESKKSQNIEESRKRNQYSNAYCKNVASPSEKLGATNEKISFKIFPAQESRIKHYYPNEPRCEVEGAIRDKFHGKRDTFESAEARNDKSPFDVALARNAAAFDATLRDGSSVPIQAGINGDAHPEEACVLRVTPKISKDPPRNDVPKIELNERWLMPRDEHDINSTLESSYHSENPGHLILDHNRNYHPASTIDIAPNETLPLTNKNMRNLVKEDAACVLNPTESVSFQTTPDHPTEEREIFRVKSPNENSFPFKPAIDNRSQIYSNYSLDVKSNKNPFENQISNMSYEIDRKDFVCANNGVLPEEQNIQNQDISADAGVITRYTCAIATVASADIPEARSEGIGAESQESFSLPPSQLGSYSKISSDATATENEIRRHNMLQQSLVRRLQNERTMLNDYRDANQLGNFNQSSKFQPPEHPKRPEPRKLESPKRLESPIGTGLLSVASSSASGMNRITALRGQYEQPDGQSKSIQKERSPIPSDAIDSSDEYLVSCANKPSRSIVLSKSESWHQLALSRNHLYSSPRPSQNTLPPQAPLASTSYLPPKPKSKSPSPYRMKKQYEASSSSDSVKKMENKIRRYFDNPANDNAAETRDSKGRRFSSRDSLKNHGLIGLSRSRTMPGICDESRLRLVIPTSPQIPVSNLNTADVDKVFDDIFEEATRADDHHF